MAWEIPSWIDEAFLASTLQGDDTKQNVSIVKYSVKPAVPTGENYSSQIYRVAVNYTTDKSSTEQTTSLIIKAPHTKGIAAEFTSIFVEFDVFAKEKRIYDELLPKMHDKLNLQFGPKFLHSPVEKVLVLQDLNEGGYTMAKRHQQLDFPHCSLVLSVLAKYHACSVAIHKENPTFLEGLGRELLYSNESPIGQQLKGWTGPLFNIIGGILQEKGGCEQYIDFLSSKLDGLWDSFVEKFKPREKGLNVLNHGDFWVNNMLFKYDDSGKVKEVKFIDFAAARYTTPATDIVYFIWSSANEDVRENRLDELSDVYLQSLNATLELLKCEERLSKSELTKELKCFSDWAFTLICQFLPLVLTDSKDAINTEELTLADMDLSDPSNQMLKMYEGKLFQAALPTALRHHQKWLSSLEI